MCCPDAHTYRKRSDKLRERESERKVDQSASQPTKLSQRKTRINGKHRQIWRALARSHERCTGLFHYAFVCVWVWMRVCVSSDPKPTKVRVNENAVAEVRDKMKLKLTKKSKQNKHSNNNIEHEIERKKASDNNNDDSRFTYFPTIWCISMTFFIYFIVSVTRSVIFFVLSLCLLLSLLLVFQWLCAALFFQIFIHISLVYSTRNKTNLELLQFFLLPRLFVVHLNMNYKSISS